MSEDAHVFAQTVLETALGKGVSWNDLESAAPELRNAITGIFTEAVQRDIFRKFWLNDTAKETISGGFSTGTADADYNEFDGIWKLLMADAATSPSASQIKRVAINNGAVAQVDDVTLTGTSGTANVPINGVNYLATFATDLNTTVANFVSTHAAGLALRKVTLTVASNKIRVTSAEAGRPVNIGTIATVSGNLAGTTASVTANTVAAALAADEAIATLKSLYEGAFKELKGLPASEKKFYVSDAVYDNYLATLEGDTSGAGTKLIQDGVMTLYYRGIEVVPMGWNVYIDADFLSQYSTPHRIIYTAPSNLVLALDATSDFSQAEAWYNKDEQENRFRMQMKMGAQYVFNRLTAVAY
jgi:hypothetical protein